MNVLVPNRFFTIDSYNLALELGGAYADAVLPHLW